MRKLALVHHGWADASSGLLTPFGFAQMGRLVRLLQVMIKEGEKAIVLSATAPEAVQSSGILASGLGVSVENHDILQSVWVGARKNEHLRETLALIESKSADYDVIIVVGNYTYVGGFPAFFCDKHLGEKLAGDARIEGIMRGESFVIDCEKKTCRRLTKRMLEGGAFKK